MYNKVDNIEYAIQEHLAITGKHINIDISNKTSPHYVWNTQNSELHMYVENLEINNSTSVFVTHALWILCQLMKDNVWNSIQKQLCKRGK